jgi:hypothetical protein
MSKKDMGKAGGLYMRGRAIPTDDAKAWRQKAKEIRRIGGRMTFIEEKDLGRFLLACAAQFNKTCHVTPKTGELE